MSGSESLFVEPDELRAVAAEVVAATRSLEDARGALDAAGVNVGAGIDHSDRADDKVATFVRQWRAEFDALRALLGGFSDVLTSAAECYEDLDADLSTCFR